MEKVLPNGLNSPLDEEKQEQIVPEKSARLNLGTKILDFYEKKKKCGWGEEKFMKTRNKMDEERFESFKECISLPR